MYVPICVVIFWASFCNSSSTFWGILFSTLGFGEIEEVLKTDVTYEHTICSRLGVTAKGMMS